MVLSHTIDGTILVLDLNHEMVCTDIGKFAGLREIERDLETNHVIY